MKGYVTKYWQTEGITEGEVTGDDEYGYMYLHGVYKWGTTMFADKARAVAHVEYLRARKIAQLERQLYKVRHLEISTVTWNTRRGNAEK